MKATLNIPPSVVLIEAALEGLVQANVVLIQAGKVPPSPLDTSVRYKRESSGLEEWDNALTVMKRGWGDCEDLNGWECAFINLTEDEWAVCGLIQTGPKLFHCIVRMSDGSIRDVCPALGMKQAGTNLAGIPWLETRAENIIGAPYRPKPSRTPYNPNRRGFNHNATVRAQTRAANAKAGRARGGSSSPGYVPKSSRPPRQEQETQTPEGEVIDAVTPTSASQTQATQAVPMQDFAAQTFADVQSLVTDPVEDPEEFDEDLEATEDEDEEELTS